MKDFASDHGIVLEKSAAHSPSTNGVAESHVGIAKCILQKSENYEAFQDGLARYRNCPRPASQGTLLQGNREGGGQYVPDLLEQNH